MRTYAVRVHINLLHCLVREKILDDADCRLNHSQTRSLLVVLCSTFIGHGCHRGVLSEFQQFCTSCTAVHVPESGCNVLHGFIVLLLGIIVIRGHLTFLESCNHDGSAESAACLAHSSYSATKGCGKPECQFTADSVVFCKCTEYCLTAVISVQKQFSCLFLFFTHSLPL